MFNSTFYSIGRGILLEFINGQKVIYDSSLIMAIIAINMTIIGLTSLAEFKRVIGIDYGNFLIKKFRLLFGVKIYHLLVIFAVVNVSSLFFMFIDNGIFRLSNFLLLVLSLIFAIYYFFSFIIVENNSVRKQIYQAELEGLYYDSDNTNHQEADKLTEMSSGSSRHKKVSSNLIEFFNTYNYDTQVAFRDVFGPDSILYDHTKKRFSRYKKQYNLKPYDYRKESENLADISYEFFQFFRYSDLQDKWAIEMLRLMDGDRQHIQRFSKLRLYNFARLLTQINLFVRSGNIYKYKFLEYLKRYYYQAVKVDDKKTLSHSEKVKEVEMYTYRQLLILIFRNIETKDELYYQYGQNWIIELVKDDSYKGLLSKHDFISILLDKALEIANEEIEQVFAEALTAYYQQIDEEEIPDDLKLNAIKNRIEESHRSKTTQFEIKREDLCSG